jgi:hypothetical protein
MQEAQCVEGKIRQFRFKEYVKLEVIVPRETLHQDIVKWSDGTITLQIQVQETDEGSILHLIGSTGAESQSYSSFLAAACLAPSEL